MELANYTENFKKMEMGKHEPTRKRNGFRRTMRTVTLISSKLIEEVDSGRTLGEAFNLPQSGFDPKSRLSFRIFVFAGMTNLIFETLYAAYAAESWIMAI